MKRVHILSTNCAVVEMRDFKKKNDLHCLIFRHLIYELLTENVDHPCSNLVEMKCTTNVKKIFLSLICTCM